MKTDSQTPEQTESSGSGLSLGRRQKKRKSSQSKEKRRRSEHSSNDGHKRIAESVYLSDADSTGKNHYNSPSKRTEIGAAIGALRVAERILAMEKSVSALTMHRV